MGSLVQTPSTLEKANYSLSSHIFVDFSRAWKKRNWTKIKALALSPGSALILLGDLGQITYLL